MYPDSDVLNADINGDVSGNGFGAGPFIGLMGSGNAGVVRQRYEWDAENRLAKIEPAALASFHVLNSGRLPPSMIMWNLLRPRL